MTTGAQAITTIHLVILAILALLVVAGMVWGARLRQRRRAGLQRREEHQAAVEAAPSVNTAVRQEQAQEQSQERDALVHRTTPLAPLESETDTRPGSDRMADEPIAAAAPMAASPAAEATASGVERATSPADQPVTILKGLGPKLAVRLGELGIATVGDIAALDPAQAEALDAQLGAFTGRLARDRWIEQARLLAAGDRAGFEAAFGKL